MKMKFSRSVAEVLFVSCLHEMFSVSKILVC